jgi:hypothetical protein
MTCGVSSLCPGVRRTALSVFFRQRRVTRSAQSTRGTFATIWTCCQTSAALEVRHQSHITTSHRRAAAMHASRRAGTWLLYRRQRSGNVMTASRSGTRGDGPADRHRWQCIRGARRRQECSGRRRGVRSRAGRVLDRGNRQGLRHAAPDLHALGGRQLDEPAPQAWPGVAWFAAAGQHVAVRCRGLPRPA